MKSTNLNSSEIVRGFFGQESTKFGNFYQTIENICFNHTTYSRNNMGQKCEGNCGLWVLHEIIKRMYPESLKKIVGAVWKLPAK